MRRRVLVVDDEDDFLATYERLLRRQGYDVVTATSRAAGLAALAGEPPHLVISDLRLPDGDGLDVVRAALAAGATTFLAKPFAAAVLLAAIGSIVDGAGARAT